MEDQVEQEYLPLWKTEYPDGCNTTIRCVVRKVGLYDLEMISLQGCNFQTDRLAYDSIPFLKLSHQSPIEFIQKSYNGTQCQDR